MKPKVVVCVLTGVERGSWPNPDLSVNLFTMARDPRFDVTYYPVRDMRPWDAARNLTIVTARQQKADWLLSMDNDGFVRGNPLDVIAAAGPNQHVIGLTSGIVAGKTGITGPDGAAYTLCPDKTPGVNDDPFTEVDYVGGGCLFVRKTVWEKIPQGPYFRWLPSDNELLAPPRATEEGWFCHFVRQAGLRVWTHRELLAGHYRTMDITGMVCTAHKPIAHTQR